MLPSTFRFHGHNSLRRAYSSGQSVRGPLFSLKYVRNNKRKNYRLAVVVSKKACKSAVGRNRIRRRVYEAFRQNHLINEPYDIVMTVFAEQVKDLPRAELSKAIISQVRQAGLDKKHS